MTIRFLLSALLASHAFAQSQLIVRHPAYGPSSPLPAAPGTRLSLLLDSFPNAPALCLNQAQLNLYSFGLDQQWQPTPLPTTTTCASEIDFLIPANIPYGPAELFLSLSGRNLGPALLTIRASALGILTVHPHSYHAAPALDFPRPVADHRLSESTRPGDTVVIPTTGRGSIPANRVAFRLGRRNLPARLRPATTPGLEEFDLTIPANLAATGCYVPLELTVDGASIHTTTIPIAPDGGPCRHRLGLDAAQLQQLDQDAEIPAGILRIDAIASLDSTVSASPTATFRTLSAFEAAYLSGLDDDAPSSTCTVTRTSTGYSGTDRFYAAPARASFSAGPQLRLTSPTGSTFQLAPPAPNSLYQLPTPPTGFFPRLPLPAGEWTLSAPGSDTVAPFSFTFSIPPPITIRDRNRWLRLRPGSNPDFEWDPTPYRDSDRVQVALSDNRSALLFCTALATAGRMRLPLPELLAILDNPTFLSFDIILRRGPGLPDLFPLPLTTGDSAPAWIDLTIRTQTSTQVER